MVRWGGVLPLSVCHGQPSKKVFLSLELNQMSKLWTKDKSRKLIFDFLYSHHLSNAIYSHCKEKEIKLQKFVNHNWEKSSFGH
jgi:hypothetical protein